MDYHTYKFIIFYMHNIVQMQSMMTLYKHKVTVSTVRLIITYTFIIPALTKGVCYRQLLTTKVGANNISYMFPVCALRSTLQGICFSVYDENYKQIVYYRPVQYMDTTVYLKRDN